MKKKDEFENNIYKMIQSLQEDESKNLIVRPPSLPDDVQTKNIQKKSTIKPPDISRQKSDKNQNEEYPYEYQYQVSGKNIKYLSTKDLFTSPPPSNSDSWLDEIKTQKKTMYIPLSNGKIIQDINKKLNKYFLPKGAAAARYNERQFRIIINGEINYPQATVLITKKKSTNDISVQLEQLKMPILKILGTNKVEVNTNNLEIFKYNNIPEDVLFDAGLMEEKSKNEQFNLNKYIYNILSERKSKTDEHTVQRTLINQLMDIAKIKWFGQVEHSLATTTANRIFFNKELPFIAVDDIGFILEKFEIFKNEKGESQAFCIGRMTMDTELWIDARIAPNNKLWEFRTLLTNTPFLIKRF